MTKKKDRRIEHWHIIALLLGIYDLVAVNFSYFMALWFRFDCMFSHIPQSYMQAFLKFAPIYSVICAGCFVVLRLYKTMWRFASFHELICVLSACAVTTVAHIVGISFIIRMPVSYFIIGMGLQLVLLLGIRFSYRIVLIERNRSRHHTRNAHRSRVMLVGAGNAGQLILQDANRRPNGAFHVCCIIDDNPNKWGRYIDGVPIVGGRDDILLNVKKYSIDKIFVALPSATAEEKRGILNICKETGCEVKNLPGMYQLVSGQISVGAMQAVAVEDLLGRDTIKIDMGQIYSQISGKTILVTGGGGSIGSELCRQVAGHQPGQLVIFDVYENNAYEIEQELKEKYPSLNLQVLIGSVRDSRCLEKVFGTYRPDIVYHAAAHKHVPLMEGSPCESIKNNVIGTYKTAYAAMLYGCKRFVLISTDKAVNPTNIMGASKRLCEMVIQTFDQAVKGGWAAQLPRLFTHYTKDYDTMESTLPEAPATEYVAVRFGNVLGSNGSVIPLFKKQIAKGGPVTVTHPDIIRYFMTIPEAVSLVMQAGTYANGGEIFVLDMGAPVRIDDLARNLIKLCGYRPDVDIPIVYSGLRPGEKLYEEKLMAEEGMKRTENELIHIGNPIAFDVKQFLEQLQHLMRAAHENDPSIREMVRDIVPTYHPAGGAAGEKDETYHQLRKEMVGAK